MITYALIGNDVCNGHHTTDNYTPKDQFKAAVLGTTSMCLFTSHNQQLPWSISMPLLHLARTSPLLGL